MKAPTKNGKSPKSPVTSHLTRRTFLGVSLAAGIPSLLGARSAVAQALAVKRPTTLQLLIVYSSEAQRNALEAMLGSYQKATPSVTIKSQYATLSNSPQVLQTRLTANDPPDILFAPPTRVLNYAKAGMLLDVGPLLPAGFKEKFTPVAMKTLEFQNQLVGLPFHWACYATAVNLDAMAAAGVSVPTDKAWTWDQAVQAAQAVQKTGKKRWGLAIRNSADSIIQYVYQNGGRLVMPDGKRPALSEPPAVEAFQWIVDLHKQGLAVPGVIAGSEDPIPLFASGQIPLFLAGGTFNVATLVNQVKSFKFGFTFSPQKVKHAILLGFQVITSFKRKDTDPQEVWKFMEFATRPENMVPVTDSGGNFPARLDARPKNYPRPDLIPLFIEASKYADEALNLDTLQPYWSATRELILRELGEAVSGQKTVKQATEAMDKALAAELAKK